MSALDWIEWNGGECPVDIDVLVEIKGADGELDTGAACDFCWDWLPTWPESNIVGYRIFGHEAAQVSA